MDKEGPRLQLDVWLNILVLVVVVNRHHEEQFLRNWPFGHHDVHGQARSSKHTLYAFLWSTTIFPVLVESARI